MNKILGSVLALATLALTIYLVIFKPSFISTSVSEYTNTQYGILFEYPTTYAVREKEVGNSERRHYSIALISKTWLANQPPEAGEGPTAITFEIYQNNLDKISLEDWVRGANDSNFKLSPDGTLSKVPVAGTQALFYRWDGLYRGESYALAHKGTIIVISVTYDSPTDPIHQDFQSVLSSLDLQ
jgi:hypothetical protein